MDCKMEERGESWGFDNSTSLKYNTIRMTIAIKKGFAMSVKSYIVLSDLVYILVQFPYTILTANPFFLNYLT